MKDLPFSFYEFLAVLMPGFFFSMMGVVVVGSVPNIKDDNVLHGLLVLCISYIVGQTIGQFSFAVIERLTRKMMGEPCLVLLNKEKEHCFFKLLFPGYYGSLRADEIDKYLNLIKVTDLNDINEVTYGPVFTKARHNEVEAARLNHWSRLFGFSRNMAFGSLISFFILGWLGFSQSKPELHTLALVSIFLALVMYYRFLRFYRTYSVDLIRWFIAEGKPLS